ncbi:hypothetical protein PR048_032788 [Dryococelus australis]|uniref:Uncharacterized protein n=1 Tax=Dryococelus australis TaxID=614101 RepID=A0ABQ9G7D7_9NEOP|nr:hypothetical protein PR048_032788 [Dryococelus australis]
MVDYPEGTKDCRLHDPRKPGKIVIAADLDPMEKATLNIVIFPQHPVALVEVDVEENDQSSISLEPSDLHRFEESEVRSQAGNIIVEVDIVDSRNNGNQAIAEPR